MKSSRNQYGFPVMNNEIIYVSRVFALNQKELVVIPTSFFIFKSTKIRDESSHLFLTKKSINLVSQFSRHMLFIN
jgi:hypothetical protein